MYYKEVPPGCTVCSQCHLQCVYTLCDLGCNLEMVNNAKETALLNMVQHNRMDCVMALLTKGADAAAYGDHGNNALHMAVLVGM